MDNPGDKYYLSQTQSAEWLRLRHNTTGIIN